ncbi:MAG: choice-of-anchor J domain-containing protein, partial [Spartobacteria bacterium]
NPLGQSITGTISLVDKPPGPTLGTGLPPRYLSYPAGDGQADDAGEPSLGVDWNPNVASLKHDQVNTGGVAFFTSGDHEWRVNFDDCGSPAYFDWQDVSTVFDRSFVLGDPIGFVDHYTSVPLGVSYPPPYTPGRVFALQLIGGQGNSASGYSDNDGASYLPGGNGGPGAGPDHQTLGGGPYHDTPPLTASYPATGPKNAIYYCSQNIAAEAQCSRSDNGGQTFGPAVLLFIPTQCLGGIHGHIKVAPDGTVYVPNSSCGLPNGSNGVAVSIDNGVTWTQRNVSGSTGNQDPSVGIGQNNVGKPGTNLEGTNTIYLGWISSDGHAHVAHSGDRGATYTGETDVGLPFGVKRAVFPVVVAGDDNRAAFAFLGTGDGISTNSSPCDPYGAVLNCKNIWHLYVATTYDGGTSWITIDATPNDPVQTGTVCLEGTTCAGGRNLLDFNDFTVDAQGRGLVGFADGCVNCSNTFAAQSAASHGTVSRQSGGRRLFAFFDPAEPAAPAPPQLLKARTLPNGTAAITWLEPDNGGSPITGYKVYRGTASGTETFLADVTGANNTKYFDTTPPSGNVLYYVTAVNQYGESGHCRELQLTLLPACVQPTGPFFDDLEPPKAGWQVETAKNDAGPASQTWQVINDPNAHSLTHSYFSDASTVQPKDDRLIAPPLNVSGTTHLTFWHRFQFENGYDGGVLEVSADNGDTWVDVVAGGGSFVSGGYNGTINPGFGSAIAGRPAWTGGSASGAMTKVDVNLGAFAGVNVKVRFRLVTDFLETPGVGWFIDDVGFDNLASCPLVPTSVVSRKTHGSKDFDVNITLIGTRAVEPRSGGPSGAYTLVFTFPANVTNCGTSTSGAVSAGPAANQCTVSLTGVANAQYKTVTLTGAADIGGKTSNVSATFGVLVGDTNGDASVNSADISQTKSQSGQLVTSSNFREDLNVDDSINSADISLVKSSSGTSLPAARPASPDQTQPAASPSAPAAATQQAQPAPAEQKQRNIKRARSDTR